MEAVVRLFRLEGAPAASPRYNIAPTQPVVAVRPGERAGREARMLRWGLVPHWSKGPDNRYSMINARLESVAQKPAYRNAFRYRRCLVPADGFYEWRRDGLTKTPYFITTCDDQPFGLAALWEAWTDKQTGERIESTTLITTAQPSSVRRPHPRDSDDVAGVIVPGPSATKSWTGCSRGPPMVLPAARAGE